MHGVQPRQLGTDSRTREQRAGLSREEEGLHEAQACPGPARRGPEEASLISPP